MGYSMFQHPETFRNSRSPATVALDIMTDCHPLATTVCVRPGSPYATSRGSRTQRKDKSRSFRKHNSARCSSSSPVSRTSVPCSANKSDGMCNFPSTPSEYAAYKAALNATFTTTTLSSAPPIHVPLRSIPAQTITPVVNIIPTLSLNLGLSRAVSSSTHSSALPHPHHQSLSSNQTSKRRRLSKSVIAEAQWWIKMYESLAWHIKQVEERQQQSPFSRPELAFLERLEAQVRSQWYPIVEKARMMTRRDDISGCRIIPSEELPSGSFKQSSPALQRSGLHGKWRLSCQELVPSDSAAMLGPTQLAAQAFLRRSQASGKPMRRKRHISPGCSALRCEITA